MQYIEIEPTYKSPRIVLNPKDGRFVISGRSVLMDVEEFYKPMIDWMDEYIQQSVEDNIEITFDLEYFNLASSKRFLFLLYRLQEASAKGVKVTVNWHYPSNDENILEKGMDFSTMLDKISFNFVGYEKLKQTTSENPPKYSMS